MPDEFQHDVFLSHRTKDNTVVRPLAERLRKDGLRAWFDDWELKPPDSLSPRERARVRAMPPLPVGEARVRAAKTEQGLEHSRVLVLRMSKHAFGADWTQLESGTFRFRDPLNKHRRFIPPLPEPPAQQIGSKDD